MSTTKTVYIAMVRRLSDRAGPGGIVPPDWGKSGANPALSRNGNRSSDSRPLAVKPEYPLRTTAPPPRRGMGSPRWQPLA